MVDETLSKTEGIGIRFGMDILSQVSSDGTTMKAPSARRRKCAVAPRTYRFLLSAKSLHAASVDTSLIRTSALGCVIKDAVTASAAL